MGIIASLIAMAELALQLWVSKEKRKYIDEIARIKKDYYAEQNKPIVAPPENPNAELRSDAVIDNLKFELCVVSASIAADVGKPVT